MLNDTKLRNLKPIFNGTTEFQTRAIRAAVDGKLGIMFADPALRKRRQTPFPALRKRRQAPLQDNSSATRKWPVPKRKGLGR